MLLQFRGTERHQGTRVYFLRTKNNVIEMLILDSLQSHILHLDTFPALRKGGEIRALPERKNKHLNIKKKVRQRDWNVGTASKSAPCNHQRNPRKITQSGWFAHARPVCLCARTCVCAIRFRVAN